MSISTISSVKSDIMKYSNKKIKEIFERRQGGIVTKMEIILKETMITFS